MAFKITDSHIHFWDLGLVRLDWAKGEPVLEQNYHPPRLFEEAGAEIEIERIVMVQVASGEDAIKEVRWVDSQAGQHPQIRGIVAFAPLEDPTSAARFLDTYRDIPRVKGIRRNTQGEALGFARQANFVRGVQMLPDYGLSCDLCIYHPQMEDILALVEQCPDVQFVLDHIGKPGIKDQILEPWKTHFRTLASFDNVWCKLSGMVTEADHQHWTAEDLRPYVDHVVECFGTDRLMYGGDWPVVKLASSYQRWFQTIRQLTAHWSEADKQKVFYDNAGTFYRL